MALGVADSPLPPNDIPSLQQLCTTVGYSQFWGSHPLTETPSPYTGVEPVLGVPVPPLPVTSHHCITGVELVLGVLDPQTRRPITGVHLLLGVPSTH